MNEQGETNLRNIGGWTEAVLDQGPRSLLTLGALVGGVIVPLLVERRRLRNPGQAQAGGFAVWLWPTIVCVPACLLAVVSNVPRKLERIFGGTLPRVLDIRGGESKELFLALSLFLYMASIWARLGRFQARTA